jgi:hypothetical protein
VICLFGDIPQIIKQKFSIFISRVESILTLKPEHIINFLFLDEEFKSHENEFEIKLRVKLKKNKSSMIISRYW